MRNSIPVRIVFEDKYLIVIEKREGLLSVSTAGRGGRGGKSSPAAEITAHSLLNNYMKNTTRGGRIFIVHRLDRETSGLMVFAKSEEIKFKMQQNWDKMVTSRKYIALVNGLNITGEAEEGKNYICKGRIVSWLKENRAFVVYSSPKDNGGQLAITNYKVLQEFKESRKSLVELELETGRKNQIRVHLQDIGFPIYGDKKYYGENPAILAENKKASRLFLHAHTLNFIHPITGKEMKFTTGIPRKFMPAK